MIDSARSLATEPVEIVSRIDDDEAKAAEYRALAQGGWISTLLEGPRLTMSDLWNPCAAVATGDILMLGADDVVFRTQDWDEIVRQAFDASADKILMVYGDDGSPLGKTFATHPIIHRRWYEAIGRFTPPYFSCDFADCWPQDIADMLGRKQLLPFVAEHMHWVFGKGPVDQTMSENIARHRRDNPPALYKKLLPEREAEAAKLRKLMTHAKWSILILTVNGRQDFLARLLSVLRPQVANHAPNVEIIVRLSDRSLPLGENREILRRQATGDYISFVDDDDLVAEDFVERVLPLLDGVDQVAFGVQQFNDGVPTIPSFVSLRYGGWYTNTVGHYRDIVHICPMRRELAMAAPIFGGWGEDQRWVNAVRALGIVRTEHVIPAQLYFYYWRSRKEELYVPEPEKPPVFAMNRNRLNVPKARETCPECASACVIPANDRQHCNQCGANFQKVTR